MNEFHSFALISRSMKFRSALTIHQAAGDGLVVAERSRALRQGLTADQLSEVTHQRLSCSTAKAKGENPC